MNELNLLFYKEGFSFCTKDAGKYSSVSHFKVSHFSKWEEEVLKELQIDLRLRRSFSKVKVGFISSFFNLVPNEYLLENPEDLLNFSEGEFEENTLLKSSNSNDSTFVFGTSQSIIHKLHELYSHPEIYHSGTCFYHSIDKSGDEVIHVNLNHHNLEVLIMRNSEMVFYNMFETLTGEDILFYTLFTIEQLGINAQKTQLKTYGQLLPNTKVFQILKKYIRHVHAGLKEEEFLENFTLYNLSKCELSPVHSEEKKL